MSSLKDIRTEYSKQSMSIEDLKQCPAEQLKLWIEDASIAGVEDANAFCLSTINRLGFPTGRIVLARQIDVNGVVFYTNKNSAKGREIESMSKATKLPVTIKTRIGYNDVENFDFQAQEVVWKLGVDSIIMEFHKELLSE